MEKSFGYRYGAYSKSNMPNIAVYCNATIKVENKFINVHVINLIGLAFDSREQPDYIFYRNKSNNEIIDFYKKMWKLFYKCAKFLYKKEKINRVKIYNVGGGAFKGNFFKNFVEEVFLPSFLPIKKKLDKKGIKIERFDFEKKVFNGGFIPTIFQDEKEKYQDTLYVNARQSRFHRIHGLLLGMEMK